MLRLSIKNADGIKSLKATLDRYSRYMTTQEYASNIDVIGKQMAIFLSEEAPFNKNPLRKSRLQPPPGSLKGVGRGSDYGFYYQGVTGAVVQIRFFSKVNYANFVETGHGNVRANDYIGRAVRRMLPILPSLVPLPEL